MSQALLALVVAAKLLGGSHWRIETDKGPVHVFAPEKYKRSAAGIVVYVHGYYDDVDGAWREHKLAEQLAAANKQALFIIPDAPKNIDDEVRWTALGDLLRTVKQKTGIVLPAGPVVVVGHSAAYRTIVPWLTYSPLAHVILIDAFYGNEEDYAQWLDGAKGHTQHRLTIVADDTIKFAEPFVKRYRDAVVLAEVPDRIAPAARKARVLYIRSKAGHMPLITAGKTLPVVLQRTPLADRAKVRAR